MQMKPLLLASWMQIAIRFLLAPRFNSSGNKGIACGLNNLQKIRDGEPLGGKASAESDFASDEDDDFLN